MKNKHYFPLANQLLPGGGLGGYALDDSIRLIFSHAQGPFFWNVEEKQYTDYSLGAGALILGHSHPALVSAGTAQMQKGMHMFGSLSDVAIDLATRLVAGIPCAEKVAYTTTGSEATAYAMRLARAFTKREKIIKFEGAYHGNHDYALVSTFPPSVGDYPKGKADTAGQPMSIQELMLIAPYNDLSTTTKIAEENADDLAAIIVEPTQRIIAGDPEFLHGLRKLCDRLGALLIFDEVVTGFRLAYGGAQVLLGMTPDLASFGKIIGGGGPLAIVAGRAEVIDLADPRKKGQPDYTYFNGTLHGNPVAAAMTLALLDELEKPEFYKTINRMTADFCEEIQKILNHHRIPALAVHVGSMWQLLFMSHPPRSQKDMMAGDTAAMRRLDSELIKQGQYVLPGVRRFMSFVHDEVTLEKTREALDLACHTFKQQ